MTIRAQILILWTRLAPYKEILGDATGIVVTLSGGVAWAVAHFATHSQVLYLECRITNNVETLRLPIDTAMTSAAVEWRTAQIRQLARQLNPDAGESIKQLTAEIEELQRQQKKSSEDFRVRLAKMAQDCSRELPTKEAAKNP